MSYGQYRAVLATNRNQADRRAAFLAHYGTYAAVAQHLRDALPRRLPARLVPRARARLHDDARRGAARQQHPALGRRQPDRGDARRRRAAAPLSPPAPPRAQARPVLPVRLLDPDRRLGSPLRLRRGARADRRRRSRRSATDYQARMWRGFRERWIDVYENDGKRSGAYSAPVYGVHPYMLLNWADTLDDVFTLAHEMGHSMHTMLSHERQPFVYSDYTIFVAEVPSTLSEALLLEHWLAARHRARRAHRAAAARDRQHHEHVLHAGAVRRLRAGRAQAASSRTSRSRPTC